MGWLTGFEPATPGITIRCSNQLSYNHHNKWRGHSWNWRTHVNPVCALILKSESVSLQSSLNLILYETIPKPTLCNPTCFDIF
jgi:hypothetical protein